MSIINGISATKAAQPMTDTQGTSALQAASITGLKVCYGDPARAQGLQNMLDKLSELKHGAETTVSARNPALP